MRRTHFLFWVVGLSVLVTAACGARGPLDINGIDYDHKDSGVTADTGVMIADTGADVGREAGREGGLVNCGQCIAQKCGAQLLMCVQSMPCRTLLQCAVTNCFGGMNGFDPQCLLNKCGGDLSAFAQLLTVITCVASNCGQDCVGVLGGM